MKLEEAIKWNKDRIIRVGLFACKEELDAMELGIEAMEFLSQWERDHNGEKLVILLGETED